MTPQAYVCKICGALIAWTPNSEYLRKHENWHETNDSRINAAAKVGEIGDMANRLLA